jgi:hypothetical protein
MQVVVMVKEEKERKPNGDIDTWSIPSEHGLITSCRMPNVFRGLGASSKRVRPQA